MYRNNQQIATADSHNFVLNNAALGDMISSLPAIVFARKFYLPNLKMRVWVPTWQTDLVRHLLAPYGEFEYCDLAKFPRKHTDRKLAGLGQITYNAAVQDQHTRNRVHMVDYAFNFLLDAAPESMEERNYPTAAPLGIRRMLCPAGKYDLRYVVFPVGATSDNKLFRASVMGPVMKWCQDNRYATVIVGTKTSHTATKIDGEMKAVVMREQSDMLPPEVFAKCIDMRERTTLLELRDILGYAAAVVGVDGGTLHLAGTTDVPIVFASGTTLPTHRYIPRHGSASYKIRYVGPRDLSCTGCQSRWVMTTLHFTQCAYGDSACMSPEHMSSDDFIAGLKELGL